MGSDRFHTQTCLGAALRFNRFASRNHYFLTIWGRVPNGSRQVPRLTDLESMQQIVRTISFNAFVSIALLQNMFEPTLGMYNLTNWG